MNTTTGTPPITLTKGAVQEVKRLLQAQNMPDAGLRVGVHGGGCSGLSYDMSFDNKISEHDHVFEVDGLKVIVDLKSSLYLQGTTLDFVNSLTGGGLQFINPNAKHSCGCGESFSA
jgi:iron-sulfur cluster assembly protein